MSTKIEQFEKAELLTSDKIICKINKGEWNDIFKGLIIVDGKVILPDLPGIGIAPL